MFDMDTYNSIVPFIVFNHEFQKGGSPEFCDGLTGFAITTQFFELVTNAMRKLQDTLTLEIVVPDVITGTSKLISGQLGYRPQESPARYTRMWLSNVP